MSEKRDDKFYKYNHTIGLVTNASYIIQNLALLNTEDYYKADCLTVAHEGFINYIPLVNTSRRCKYIPICAGCDRGKGIIKWMKWIKIKDDTYFVCLSTIGIQFYDIELTDVQFEFDFKELNGRISLPLGACVLGDTLFVGTAMGMIAMFQSTDECIRMVNNLKVSTFLYIDGADDCLVAVAREEMKSYRFEEGKLHLISVVKETLLSPFLIGFSNINGPTFQQNIELLLEPRLLFLEIWKTVPEKSVTGATVYCTFTKTHDDVVHVLVYQTTILLNNLKGQSIGRLYSILRIFKENLFIGHHTGDLSFFLFPSLSIIAKQKMHDGEITALDYSNKKQILLTGADDLMLKAWKFNKFQKNWECIYEMKSEDRPYCGVSFTNRNCTEFCCVKSNSLIVTFYIENNQPISDNESSDEDFTSEFEAVSI